MFAPNNDNKMKPRFCSFLLALLLAVPGWSARDFDGVDDNLNCGSAANLDDLKAGGAVTIAAWVRPDTTGEGGSGSIVTKRILADTDGWRFTINSLRGIRFIHLGATNLDRVGNDDTLTLGVWQHALMTWDGSVTAANVKLYVNGTEVAYKTTINGVTLDSDAAADLQIGNNMAGTNTWDGRLAEAGIWSVILTANEIASLAKGASPATIRTASVRPLYAPVWGVASPEPDVSGDATNNNCTVTGAVLANHSPTGPVVQE